MSNCGSCCCARLASCLRSWSSYWIANLNTLFFCKSDKSQHRVQVATSNFARKLTHCFCHHCVACCNALPNVLRVAVVLSPLSSQSESPSNTVFSPTASGAIHSGNYSFHVRST
eukprot:3785398-Amphidinium_carterae.2